MMTLIPRSGIAGSHGSSIFSFLRNLYIDFHSKLFISIEQCIRVLFPQHAYQYLLFLLFKKIKKNFLVLLKNKKLGYIYYVGDS
jgi:hypothetical protein